MKNLSQFVKSFVTVIVSPFCQVSKLVIGVLRHACSRNEKFLEKKKLFRRLKVRMLLRQKDYWGGMDKGSI